MDPQVCNHSLYKNKIVAALTDIPTFSMVMDLKDLFDPATGIYVNATQHGKEWERPCSVELIYPDGTDGFQINCGVRIRGGYSRNPTCPKRAFRWFFRKEYGEGKLKYPLFGDEGVDEFDKMDLRTAMNYSWSYGAEGPEKNTFLRDEFCRDLQRDMGQPYTRSRYYHLYINGTYWGLYETQERSEASYAAYYFGGNREDYDVIKVDGGYGRPWVIEATDGTLDAWRRLWEASMAGFKTNEAYYKVQGLHPDGSRNPDYEVLLDVDNLIDFMINVFYTGDGDAPYSSFVNGPNNFYSLRNRNGDKGFVHFRHDAEHTLGAQSWAEDRTGPFAMSEAFEKFNPQLIHQKLCENPLYVDRFANHVYKHFFNGGACTPEASLARIQDRKKQIDLAIIAESARWGDSKREPAFTRNDWLNAVKYIIDDFLPNRTNVVLNQLRSKGWYPQTAPPTFNSESKLVPKGFQLTMTAPRGQIYYTTDGTDPYESIDVSTRYTNLIEENAAKKVIVPTAAIQGAWRQSLEFDDSAWRSGSGNVGYERDQGYENMIHIDVGAEMYEKQTSCFIRIPFSVDEAELDKYNVLTLKMYYDDGFAAYLNGTKVTESNVPTPLGWKVAATQNHEAQAWETFDISGFVNKLVPGENLLAIHGLNVSLTSSDFIIGTELIAGIVSNYGAISENAIEYTAPIVIDKTTHIKARVFDNVNWSAVHEATLWVLQGMKNLRITEIHYHPLDESDVDNDDGEYEFIELKNIDDETLDLSGVYFSRGITYSFPNNTALSPNAFIVLASNKSAFFTRYGFNAFDEYRGQLDNNGETIALNTAAGDTLIKIHYKDKYPWPNSADGDGYSIVSREENPYKDQNNAANWMASREIHGNPGRDNIPVSVQEPRQQEIPSEYQLLQNYPNPFNPTTKIEYSVPKNSFITLKVYNLLGQEVKTLFEGYQQRGNYTAAFDGSGLASGVYLYRFVAENFVDTKKTILLK
ncbi:MAG TPA: T9SS type A sorting domain-containing protein, partial [Bacteroidaceae bacterium]|nr:T9SS type A sorting domain-containing protein [Bacteroidaceae bacterium]